jgi:hypothetical protein
LLHAGGQVSAEPTRDAGRGGAQDDRIESPPAGRRPDGLQGFEAADVTFYLGSGLTKEFEQVAQDRTGCGYLFVIIEAVSCIGGGD